MGRSQVPPGRGPLASRRPPLIPVWRWYGSLLQTSVGQRFLDHGKLIGAASARLILPTVEGGVPWTPFRLSLEAARIALVSTAGIHLTTDPPFDVDAPLGDPSLRVIPSDTRAADLRIAHAHYGHQRAEEDMNVVFPLERLRECVADGALGDLGPRAYSFGFTVQTKELVDPEIGSAHELARRLHADQVDATIFSPA